MRNTLGTEKEKSAVFDSTYASIGHSLSRWVIPLFGLAILLTPTGLVLMAWSGRRRFGRRNVAGVEEFRSYGHSVGGRLVEGLVDRLGILLFAVGFFSAIFAGWALFLQRY